MPESTPALPDRFVLPEAVVDARPFTRSDGRQQLVLLTEDEDGRGVRLWDPTSSRLVGQPFEGCGVEFSTAVAGCSLPHGSDLILAGHIAGRLYRWDAATGLPWGEGEAPRVSLRADSIWQIVVVNLVGGPVLLAACEGILGPVDPVSGVQVGERFVGYHGGIRSIACLSAPGVPALVVAGGDDSVVRIWDFESREVLHGLVGHVNPVEAVAAGLLPDGRALVVSGGRDATVRRWDPYTGEQVGEPLIHDAPLRQLAVVSQPERTLVASCANDGVLRWWDAITGDLVVQPVVGRESSAWSLAVVHLPGGPDAESGRAPSRAMFTVGNGCNLLRWSIPGE